ncbi:MAG: hypothetical protein HZA92_20155 [Verrucomicrobia bacterium]|nr:hypothetical protein [Verrucomicrobiota bacterium]
MKTTIKMKITSKSKKAALRCATAAVLNLDRNDAVEIVGGRAKTAREAKERGKAVSGHNALDGGSHEASRSLCSLRLLRGLRATHLFSTASFRLNLAPAT